MNALSVKVLGCCGWLTFWPLNMVWVSLSSIQAFLPSLLSTKTFFDLKCLVNENSPLKMILARRKTLSEIISKAHRFRGKFSLTHRRDHLLTSQNSKSHQKLITSSKILQSAHPYPLLCKKKKNDGEYFMLTSANLHIKVFVIE